VQNDEEAISNISLEGDFQHENASVAFCALRHVLSQTRRADLETLVPRCYAALASVRHPGRFEIFKCIDRSGKERIIVVDGGHNESALEKLLWYAKSK
jgi:folylpolyglutamate synthase/dihydropteroate synthase